MDLVADIAEGKARKTRYVDNGWPTTDPDDHAVSELATDRTGALSPFGDLVFPLPSDRPALRAPGHRRQPVGRQDG